MATLPTRTTPSDTAGLNRAERRGNRVRRQLLTLADGATEIGVSERTLRRYVAEGRLQVIRINRRTIRIDPAELDRFLGISA